MSKSLPNQDEIQKAYARYTQADSIRNSRVACALVMVLMPPGYLMDIYVYPELADEFFKLRVLTSAFAGLAFFALRRPGWSDRQYRVLCTAWYVIPAFFISCMIYAAGGVKSSYYAGLNLVILAVSSVIQATLLESIIAVTVILSMYLSACLLQHGAVEGKWVANNSFFMFCTVAIVVTGNYFYNRLRFQEYSLRCELDANREVLEHSNQKLDRQNQELADTIQKLTEAESQLVQSEKMASLGRMSAGIIHEINNPLNFATTNLFTLRKKARFVAPEQKADYEDILKDVEDGISRVKNIVSDLRMFTHPSTDDLDDVEASEVVASALRFLSNEFKDKVTIEQKLPEHQVVHANRNKLIHVFVNLLHNSLDALQSKPFNNGERPTIWIEGRMENGASSLIVRDNGPGIAEEHRDKIFDPFFTTKEVGAGMGLGLSICYRIVQESQGKISVRSEVGKFCEFTLEFPVKA